MSQLPTIVISAAGRGTRMGRDMPKCMIPILGRPLIHWQLDVIRDYPRVVVAVGYRAKEVMAIVAAKRPAAEFVTNAEFESTGTASSVSLAMVRAGGPIISLDGDLLVHPHDLRKLAEGPMPSIGVCEVQSLAPVLTRIADTETGSKLATSFHHDEQLADTSGMLEWTGLVTLDPRIHKISGQGHVYQMISPLLPCRAVQVRCREIDFPEEVPLMEAWLQSLIDEGVMNG